MAGSVEQEHDENHNTVDAHEEVEEGHVDAGEIQEGNQVIESELDGQQEKGKSEIESCGKKYEVSWPKENCIDVVSEEKCQSSSTASSKVIENTQIEQVKEVKSPIPALESQPIPPAPTTSPQPPLLLTLSSSPPPKHQLLISELRQPNPSIFPKQANITENDQNTSEKKNENLLDFELEKWFIQKSAVKQNLSESADEWSEDPLGKNQLTNQNDESCDTRTDSGHWSQKFTSQENAVGDRSQPPAMNNLSDVEEIYSQEQ